MTFSWGKMKEPGRQSRSSRLFLSVSSALPFRQFPACPLVNAIGQREVLFFIMNGCIARKGAADMAVKNDLMARINADYSRMSKGQKWIANYIADYYDQAVFMTAAQLGRAVGVSESTAVRFAMSLGYSGYPAFRRDLEDNVKNRLMERQEIKSQNKRAGKSQILAQILESDRHQLEETLRQTDQNAFDEAVDIILSAKNVYIVGLGASAPLAMYLVSYLRLVRDDIHIITSLNTSEIFEQMIHIGSKDTLFGISFPRYSMRTLKAMEFANARSAKVISLTDRVTSPMNLYSSCNLTAQVELNEIAQSLVAPMSLINALLVAMARKRKSAVARQMKTLEELVREYAFDGIDELNPSDDSLGMDYPGEVKHA